MNLPGETDDEAWPMTSELHWDSNFIKFYLIAWWLCALPAILGSFFPGADGARHETMWVYFDGLPPWPNSWKGLAQSMWTCAYETETDPKTNINSWPEISLFSHRNYIPLQHHISEYLPFFPFFLTIFVNQQTMAEHHPLLPPGKKKHVCIPIPEGLLTYFPPKKTHILFASLPTKCRFSNVSIVCISVKTTHRAAKLKAEVSGDPNHWNNLGVHQWLLWRNSLFMAQQPTNLGPPPRSLTLPPGPESKGFFHKPSS